MPYFVMKCGCKCDAYITVAYDCECCGSDYDIEEAEILETCELHTVAE